MDFSRASLAIFLISMLAASHLLVDAVRPETGFAVEQEGPGRSLLQATFDCGGACAVRCGSSSRPNLCKRACGTCCSRCGCVPPGTYGNRDACPCYAKMITRGGRPKCP